IDHEKSLFMDPDARKIFFQEVRDVQDLLKKNLKEAQELALKADKTMQEIDAEILLEQVQTFTVLLNRMSEKFLDRNLHYILSRYQNFEKRGIELDSSLSTDAQTTALKAKLIIRYCLNKIESW